MEQKEMLLELEGHINRSLRSIGLLYNSDQGAHSRYLAFILIDQMSWLVSGSETKINVYFKKWVNDYLIRYYPEITADEIWASRNGHLHCHSTISRDIENKKVKRQLWFVDKLHTVDEIDSNQDVDTKIFYAVNTIKFLNVALNSAVSDFLEDIKANNLFNLDDFEIKLSKLMIPKPLQF